VATYYYDTSDTWGNWTGSTSTISYSNSAWTTWTSAGTGTATSTTSDYYIWTTWADVSEAQKETREQRRAREAQAKIEAQERDAVIEARKQAELTAQKLLEDLLNAEEAEVYRETGRVLIKGQKHDYILTKGYQTGVLKIEKGKVIDLKSHIGRVRGRRLCVHPVDLSKLPDTDKVIAMKVALEAEEDRMLKLANDHGEQELNLAANG
jgi:hypothetical protein